MGPQRKQPLKIFLSAGEASGDLHGSNLVRAVRAIEPEAQVTCLGGPLLKEAGAEVLVENKEIAVVGTFEILRHARELYNAWRRLRDHIVNERPDLVILIDFPDFNFLLGRLAKRHGIKIFYYISPQVWAWRSGRVKTLKRLVDAMAVILPFEKEFYQRRGMAVHYAGHPLFDVLGEETKATGAPYRLDGKAELIGLLPGSRRSEIRLLLPLILDAAAILSKKNPGLSFIIPVAPSLDPEPIEAEVQARRLPIRIVRGDTYGVIRSCDLIVTASGTVTLEAAIIGTPMIITYRVSDLSYYTGKHLIRVKYVGLPNLIAGSPIVPELLQTEATPEAIASEAQRLLDSPTLLATQRRELARLRERLGEPGVSNRVARLALDLCGAGRP